MEEEEDIGEDVKHLESSHRLQGNLRVIALSIPFSLVRDDVFLRCKRKRESVCMGVCTLCAVPDSQIINTRQDESLALLVYSSCRAGKEIPEIGKKKKLR